MSVSADAVAGKSTSTLLSALIINGVVAGVELAIFFLIRKRFSKIYEPRTYLTPPKKRIEPLPSGFFAWIPAILKADARQIIAKNGLDAYVFVRFLYLMLEIFLPFLVLTFAIIIPVDVAGSTGTQNGVDQLTFGNVGTDQTTRYAAHLIVVYILTFWVFYLIRREYAAFVILRQDFLISKEHSRLAQSKTVLVTGVAKEYLNVEALTKFCGFLPGGVKRIWIARNLKELPDLFDRRLAACNKLEGAETSLLKTAATAIKKNKVKDAPSPEELEANHSLIERYVPAKDRPHHRLGFLGLFGKKVDSIEWCREEIKTTTAGLEEGKAIIHGPDADKSYAPQSAAFIQFNDQIAAHMFAQCLAHHAPLRMACRYIEVDQEDVIWDNVALNPFQAKIRYLLSWAMTLGLIILWAFPVAFVGAVSNVTALAKLAPFLSFLQTLPSPVLGIIQGILPPVLLAVLFILLPIILRVFARFEGIPLRSSIEVSLMSRFFLFLVIHGFLIITLSSGIVAAIPSIVNDPSSVINLLANKLPAASTFFLTYFAVQGLSGAFGSLLQVVPLIVYYVKLYLLGSTPRAVFGIKYNMAGVEWGTLFPNMTLLTIIAITYSVIAPLMCLFALFTFGVLFFVYKYLFLWVLDVPGANESGGRFYPLALTHILVGLYIEEICLTGLFFLGSANIEGAFMIVLIVLTVLFQVSMASAYGPLIEHLPLSLAQRIKDTQDAEDTQDDPTSPLIQSPSESSDGDHHNSRDVPTPEKRRDDPTYPPTADDKATMIKRDQEGSATPPAAEHIDRHAFDHPATYETQRIIWLPLDDHGLYKAELEDTIAAGVLADTVGATMGIDGKVAISRAPPGDEWDDSQQL